MARAVRLRRSKYTVYLDEVTEEMVTPINPQDPNSATEVRIEAVLRAFEVGEGEVPPEEGTLFHLASLPLQKVLNAGNQARKGEGGQAAFDALQDSLTGWERLTDVLGNEVKFSKERIALLGMDEAIALANFVMEKASNVAQRDRRVVGNS